MLGFSPVSFTSISDLGTIRTTALLIGVVGNAQVGTFSISNAGGGILTGVSANAQVGSFFVMINPNEVNAFLTGVSANAQVGSFTTAIRTSLTGVSANAQVGSFTVVISSSGLKMSDFECTSFPNNDNDTFVSLQYSNDGGISWQNTISQSAGGIGEYGKNVQFRRLGGNTRNRVYRVRTDNPRPLTGIFVDYNTSKS